MTRRLDGAGCDAAISTLGGVTDDKRVDYKARSPNLLLLSYHLSSPPSLRVTFLACYFQINALPKWLSTPFFPNANIVHYALSEARVTAGQHEHDRERGHLGRHPRGPRYLRRRRLLLLCIMRQLHPGGGGGALEETGGNERSQDQRATPRRTLFHSPTTSLWTNALNLVSR